MKQLQRMIILLCLLISPVALAQSELDESLTTPGGMTLQYPSSFIGESDGDLGASFINIEQGTFLVVGVGDAALNMVDGDVQTSADMKDSFVRTIDIFGGLMDDEPIQELLVNNRPAFIVPFSTDAIGRGYFAAFELPDGTLGSSMLFGSADVEFPAGTTEELVAIVETVTYDAESAAVDEPTEETLTDEEVTDSTETDDTESEIPEGAILVEDLPEGMIVTSNGIQMETFEGFGLLPGTEYIEESVGLLADDMVSNIIIFDEDMTTMDIEIIFTNVLPTLAMMGGDEDFNADTDLQTLDVDGRTITYYASPEFAESEEDSLGGVFYFVIELMPDTDRMAIVQAIYGGDDVESFQTQLLDFVQTIQLTEEESAAMNAPQVVECGTQGVSFVDAETTTATVTCPAGCNNDNATIWGTSVYTNDSSICLAAIHASIIDETGGDVTVTHEEGQTSYTASEQNGVASLEYGEWDASFTVSVPEVEEE